MLRKWTSKNNSNTSLHMGDRLFQKGRCTVRMNSNTSLSAKLTMRLNIGSRQDPHPTFRACGLAAHLRQRWGSRSPVCLGDPPSTPTAPWECDSACTRTGYPSWWLPVPDGARNQPLPTPIQDASTSGSDGRLHVLGVGLLKWNSSKTRVW